jgi:hypothetical protein
MHFNAIIFLAFTLTFNLYAKCPEGFWHEASRNECVMQLCPANSLSGVQPWLKIGSDKQNYFTDDKGGVRASLKLGPNSKINEAVLRVIKTQLDTIRKKVGNNSVNGKWWSESNGGFDRCVKQVCAPGSLPGIKNWTKISNSNYYADDKGGIRVFSTDLSLCKQKFVEEKLVRKKINYAADSRVAKGSIYVLTAQGKCKKLSKNEPWHESAHYNNIIACKKASFKLRSSN